MRIAFVDVQGVRRRDVTVPAAVAPPHTFGELPAALPSPALLARAGAASAASNEVSFLSVSGDGALAAAADRLRGCDRVVIGCAAYWSQLADALEALIAPVPVERFDPWAAPPAQASTMPSYDLVLGSTGHAEADVLPLPEPVHPWVYRSVSTVSPEHAEARLEAASRCLTGPEAPLYLSDERVRVDMPRLRSLAELVRGALRERRTVLSLHLRAWPADLLTDRVLDHLSLLPVGSLEVLLGSLHPASLDRMGSELSRDDLRRCCSEILRSGLAHLARISVVVGLPGESADRCAAELDEVFQLALASRIPRIRIAYWMGEDALPTPAHEQEARFLAAHPGWQADEYHGLQDFVALFAMAQPQLAVIGPLI